MSGSTAGISSLLGSLVLVACAHSQFESPDVATEVSLRLELLRSYHEAFRDARELGCDPPS